jgi:hypothetical protein
MTEDVEIFEKDEQFSALKVLNSPSSQPFFFIVPVGKERFTNPFLGLLDSPDKNIKMP